MVIQAVLRHPDLAECAVIGVKDQVKGHIPLGLLVLKSGISRGIQSIFWIFRFFYGFLLDCTKEEKDLMAEVVKMVRQDVGPVASFKNVCVVPKLPKTRSGKIARPSLVSLAENKPVKVRFHVEFQIETALK